MKELMCTKVTIIITRNYAITKFEFKDNKAEWKIREALIRNALELQF